MSVPCGPSRAAIGRCAAALALLASAAAGAAAADTGADACQVSGDKVSLLQWRHVMRSNSERVPSGEAPAADLGLRALAQQAATDDVGAQASGLRTAFTGELAKAEANVAAAVEELARLQHPSRATGGGSPGLGDVGAQQAEVGYSTADVVMHGGKSGTANDLASSARLPWAAHGPGLTPDSAMPSLASAAADTPEAPVAFAPRKSLLPPQSAAVAAEPETLLESVAVSVTPQPESCTPRCSYQCSHPTCDQVCAPQCQPPKCETRCAEPDVSKCHMDCAKPNCALICPKTRCPSANCPHCGTQCSSPACRLVCPQRQPCRNVCEQPICEWVCDPPKDCPKPTCQMVCEHPKNCMATLHDQLPDLETGEMRVGSFQAWH